MTAREHAARAVCIEELYDSPQSGVSWRVYLADGTWHPTFGAGMTLDVIRERGAAERFAADVRAALGPIIERAVLDERMKGARL